MGSLRVQGILGATVLAAVSTTYLYGQASIGGSLRGIITDRSGAVVPNSSASLTSSETGVTFNAPVNGSGEYSFPSVAPGRYTLTVSSAGFVSAKFENVVIDLNQAKLLPVTLQVGGSNVTVEVTAESEKIVTQETSVTGLFTANQIANLPLNGRDYQNLVYLSPGVTRAASGTGQGSGVVAAGTRPTNNNYLIDGVDNNSPSVPSGATGGSSGQIGAVPLDAISEFTVISTNGSAEFGRSSGAVVNVVTKSGTNQAHGTLFEFVRNPKFNTRQWFDPLTFKSALKQNDFGGRFGVPLMKDKTFMVGAYEGYRQRQSATTTLVLPTTEAISAITQPALKALLSATFPAVSNGGTPVTAANFSTSGIASTTQIVRILNPLDGDTGFVRFDQVFSDRNQVFLTGSISNIVQSAGQTNAVPFAGYGQTQRPYHFVLGDNMTFSPRVLNSFRLGVQRQSLAFPGEIPGAALLASGSARTAGPFVGAAYSSSLTSANGIPNLNSTLGLYTGTGVTANLPQGRAENTIVATDVVNWIHGKHEIKVGAEVRRIQENGYFSATVRPSVTLLDTTFNNFISGAVSNVAQRFYLNGSSERGFRQFEQGYFLQDTWRPTGRLTVEAGIRYDLYPAFGESKNLIANMFVIGSNGQPQACTSLPFGVGMTQVALVNAKQFGLKAFCTDFNNVAPRLGFAYDIGGNGKTIIRGAWGYFYDRIFDNVYGNSRFNAPFTVATTTFPTAYDGTQATGAAAAISTTGVYSATTVDPNIRQPYTQHFNLSLGQELDSNTSVTVAYVGSIGTKLLTTAYPNFGTTFPTSFRPTNQGNLARSQSDINAGIIRGPFSSITNVQSNGNSNFHSLEVSLRRRAAHGLSGQVAYTLAHSMDSISDEIAGNTDSAAPQATYDNLLAPYLAPGTPCTSAVVTGQTTAATISADPVFTAAMQCATRNTTLTTAQAAQLFVQNYTAFRPNGSNYGDSSFDVRQRLALNVVYALPFGQGKMIGGNVNGLVNQLIGGFNLSSTIDTQSGTPFIVISGVDSNRDGNNNDRAVLLTYGSGRNPALVKNSPFYTNASTKFTQSISRFPCDPVTGALDANSRSRTCSDGSGSITFNQGIGIIDPQQRMHRGMLREPGIFNWDMELFKNFRVYRESNLRFSVDGFNILNRANFGVFSNTLSSPTNFARASSQRSINNTYSRQFQFALKYEF